MTRKIKAIAESYIPIQTASGFVTVAEVAQLLRLHHTEVRRYITSGQLKHYKLGKYFVVRTSDLDAFMLAKAAERTEIRKLKPYKAKPKITIRPDGKPSPLDSIYATVHRFIRKHGTDNHYIKITHPIRRRRKHRPKFEKE